MPQPDSSRGELTQSVAQPDLLGFGLVNIPADQHAVHHRDVLVFTWPGKRECPTVSSPSPIWELPVRWTREHSSEVATRASRTSLQLRWGVSGNLFRVQLAASFTTLWA